MHKIFEMPVADVYVHYVNKVERKNRTEAELIKVITWLTGFDSKTLKGHLKKQTTFKDFFKAAKIHPNAKLEAGMVLTVEPGLYIQPDDELFAPEYRGIGIRIEDDVLVTEDGCFNLSENIPRHPDEIEAWMASLR
jgi:hypothetical protein